MSEQVVGTLNGSMMKRFWIMNKKVKNVLSTTAQLTDRRKHCGSQKSYASDQGQKGRKPRM